MAAPAQGFLLSSNKPTQTNHSFSTRESPSPRHPQRNKTQMAPVQLARDNSHTGKECLIDNSPSPSQIFTVTHYPVKVLAQEAREVAITLFKQLA